MTAIAVRRATRGAMATPCGAPATRTREAAPILTDGRKRRAGRTACCKAAGLGSIQPVRLQHASARYSRRDAFTSASEIR